MVWKLFTGYFIFYTLEKEHEDALKNFQDLDLEDFKFESTKSPLIQVNVINKREDVLKDYQDLDLEDFVFESTKSPLIPVNVINGRNIRMLHFH